MNNPFRKSIKNVKSKHGAGFFAAGLGWFPRRLYAAYVVPALFLLCVGASMLVMDWIYAFGERGFEEGAPARRTYRVHASMTYIDAETTENLKNSAGNSVAGVVVQNIGAAGRMKLRLETFGKIENRPASAAGADAEHFSPELLGAFRKLPVEQRERLLALAAKVGDVYFEAVASGDAAGEWKDRTLLWAEINKLALPSAEKNFVYQLLDEIVEPNFKIDPQLTEDVQESERDGVSGVERMMEAGEVIVRRGEPVTRSAATALRAQGYPENKFPMTQWAVMCVLVLALPFWMDAVASRDARKPGSAVWNCVVFSVAASWVCETAAARLGIDGGGILASVTAAYLCLPRRMAFHTALVGSISGIFMAGLSSYRVMAFLPLAFIAVITGFYALTKIDSLKHLCFRIFFIGVFLALFQEAVRSLLGLPSFEALELWPVGDTWLRLGRFLVFDFAAAFLTVSCLLVIEGPLGAFTPFKARELSHPSSPLLRKLQAEAPGTYHHCLMIGALAESVANDLGMDANLMRVGAYYHDIGKIRRPRHFVENQLGGENIHDELSPTLSAVAIIAHVREGVELANEFGLPKQVRQFISEHHGTTCVGYFYKKALALGENVERAQFCYPGPKPQSRETALLMIMDSLEAAVRSEGKSISKVTDLQEIIERVIAIKATERQLDDADFTFRELEQIKAASLKALRSMYHTRTVKEINEKKEHK